MSTDHQPIAFHSLWSGSIHAELASDQCYGQRYNDHYRTPFYSLRRTQSLLITALATLLMLAAGAGAAVAAEVPSPSRPVTVEPGTYIPSAQSKTPADPTLLEGAAARYAEQYDVSRDRAMAVLKAQALGTGLENDLRDDEDVRYADLAFVPDQGTWKVTIAEGGDAAAALRILAAHGIINPQIARARWSAEARDAAERSINRKLHGAIASGVAWTTRRSDNGLTINLSSKASPSDIDSAQSLDGPVSVATDVAPRDLPSPVACGSPYCDVPLVAGVAYTESAVGNCSMGFAATAPGSGNMYNLTAGHCTWVGFTVSTCNAAITWCPTIGTDVGGYLSAAGDGGIIELNGVFPNYPAYRVFGWAYPTYGVLGTSAAYVNQYLCHTGRYTYTTCGFVSSVNGPNQLGGSSSYILQGACSIRGDSGGPLFNPANGTAVGITVASSNPNSCPPGGNETVHEPAGKAAATFGVSINHL
jgi:hypothetical protein